MNFEVFKYILLVLFVASCIWVWLAASTASMIAFAVLLVIGGLTITGVTSLLFKHD